MQYTCNISTWNDASVEMERLHAICDLALNYAENNVVSAQTVNALTYALQFLHDQTDKLDDIFCDLGVSGGAGA